MSFDPMTGKPINDEPEINFDPMTGQPIKKPAQQEMAFDPMTGKPIIAGAPVKNSGFNIGKCMKIIVPIAAVAIVGVGIYSCVANGMFLGKGSKVLLATTNTLTEQNHLVKDLSVASEAVLSGAYTMNVKGEIDKVEADVTYAQEKSKMQLKGAVDVSGIDVEFDAMMNDKEIMLKSESISDTVFMYNYVEKKDGFLADEYGSEMDEIDKILQESLAMDTQEEVAKEIIKAVTDELKVLKFEKASAQEFEIDGKDRKCKGYETSIEEDNLENIWDRISDIIEEEYDKELLEEIDFDDAEKAVEEAIGQFPDIDVTFYIYKNKLACIETEIDKQDVEIQFLGGDTRMQNMVVKVGGVKAVEIEGETEGNEEVTEISVLGEKCLEIVYDFKKGELNVEGKLEGSNILMEAVVDAGRNDVTVTLEELEVGGSKLDGDFVFAMKKGANVKAPSGEKFDIGNASKDDVEDMMEDLQDDLQDFLPLLYNFY